MNRKRNSTGDRTVGSLYEECVVAAYQRAADVLSMTSDDPILVSAQAAFAAAILANAPPEHLQNAALPAANRAEKPLSEMTVEELAALRLGVMARMDDLKEVDAR